MGNANRLKGKISPCRLCGNHHFSLVKPSNLSGSLKVQDFTITDKKYGITSDVFRCQTCCFEQCSELSDVSIFYEQLIDKRYEETRVERGIQQKKLLKKIIAYKNSGRLLDIGAGSGILVEQALSMGFDATGVEPSKFLCKSAQDRKLPVFSGLFPHKDLQAPYDVVTLIDVIEHVSNPLEVLLHVQKCLADDGIGLMVTPDVGSLAARLLRGKWWHYRIAHIGYFTKNTLLFALNKAGLKPIYTCRPNWYFKVHYLAERIRGYLPGKLNLPLPSRINEMIVPLNLFDSLLVIFSKK